RESSTWVVPRLPLMVDPVEAVPEPRLAEVGAEMVRLPAVTVALVVVSAALADGTRATAMAPARPKPMAARTVRLFFLALYI
ncbi:MAG: hypothetical protein M3396_07605, partial [Actinomycetota bacterium]|nr:hypothetical protein [Actinomycetota bacterium]